MRLSSHVPEVDVLGRDREADELAAMRAQAAAGPRTAEVYPRLVLPVFAEPELRCLHLYLRVESRSSFCSTAAWAHGCYSFLLLPSAAPAAICTRLTSAASVSLTFAGCGQRPEVQLGCLDPLLKRLPLLRQLTLERVPVRAVPRDDAWRARWSWDSLRAALPRLRGLRRLDVAVTCDSALRRC